MTSPRTLPRRRRALVTQDGTLIAQDGSVVAHDPAVLASCRGEPLPIAGEAIAMDARPRSDLRAVTFDGATPETSKSKGTR